MLTLRLFDGLTWRNDVHSDILGSLGSSSSLHSRASREPLAIIASRQLTVQRPLAERPDCIARWPPSLGMHATKSLEIASSVLRQTREPVGDGVVVSSSGTQYNGATSHSFRKSTLGSMCPVPGVDIRLPRSASSHKATTVQNSSELVGCTPWGPLSPPWSHCIAPVWEHTGRQ